MFNYILSQEKTKAQNMNVLKEMIYRLRGEYTTEKLISMGMKVGKNFGRLNGVILDGEKCKSSKLEKIDDNSCYVTLTEGKYHQIKRMFQSFGASVLELKRVSMGSLELPSDLALGECCELTMDEVYLITH